MRSAHPSLHMGDGDMRQNLFLPLLAALAGLALASPETASATCTVPTTLTNGTTADATQVMGNFNSILSCVNALPAGSTNSVQTNAGSGAFGAVGPLTNGQLVIGSTGAAPAAATLTAGTGIAITNAAGGITISASGGGSATIYSSGTNSGLTYDPGTSYVDLDSSAITVPAASVSHTYMVTGQFVFVGAGSHGQWTGIALDGTLISANAGTWTQIAGQTNVSASVGPMFVTLPGDSATHTISIQVADANATGNLTFYQRWVFAQLIN